MYPVSELYKEKIQELDRVFRLDIQIQHSLGVLNLADVDVVGGSVSYTESSQSGEDFTIGAVVASNFTIEIMKKVEYESIEFMGATTVPTIGLLLREKQGSIEELWEDVPLGRFNIDDINRQRNTIKIKAIDNMIYLEKPYSLSRLSYPATLYQIYVNICNVCDIQIGTVDFPNKDLVVNERPKDDLTFRDVLKYVAELSGTFAMMNRFGALELRWYEESGITITPDNRFNFVPRDDLVQIKGVMASVEDTTYLAGTDEYAIDLTENPLLQDGHEIVLPNIFNNIKLTNFYPYESSWQGNPAVQAGDIVTHIDIDGNVIKTLVTTTTYKYRGSSTLSAKGTPIIKKGFKGSTNKKIAQIVRKVEEEVGDKLTTLQQAQLNATEMIANMLGGHLVTLDDSVYIADNPDVKLARKVWKWGIGGFGYSSTGIEGPYNTAITADGSIVAMLVAAKIITADMVNTGMLQSEDGSTWINLDNGSFNFKDSLKWVDNHLSINSPDLDKVVKEDELYNHVKISKEKGIQIIDRGQRERVRIGNYKQGKYGMIISDKSGSTTVLDEDGIMQTWQEGNVDNVSEIKPLVLYVHIPKHTSIIHKAILRFKREAFRAYSKSTTTQPSATQTSSSGGAVLDTTSTTLAETKTTWGGIDVEYDYSWTQSGGADGHSHKYRHVLGHAHNFEIPSHNHEINIPEHSHDVEIPEHSHDMVYGIFEDIVADNITISINSTDYTSFLGAKNGVFNSDEEDLDITTLLEIGKWNRVEIGSGNLGRIDATIFLQTFMQTIRKSVILDEAYIDNGVIGFGTNLGDVSLSGQRISHKSNIDRVYKAEIVRGTANLSFLDWNKQVEGWKHLYVIGENVDGVSVCLDGTWEFDYEEQRYFLETEDTPWMFWIVGGTLYKQYGTDETTRKVLAESVKKVASIRGWSNFAFPENDHGLVVGYIKNDGRVYYRNYAMQSNGLKRWEEEKLVSGFVGVAKDLNLFTTNDYRLGFTVENISEYISWHITDRNWAGMAIAPEKITGGIGNILVDLVKLVHRYSSVNEKINIGINTTVDFLYAKSDNKFESIVNIPDETMNYGRFIRFKVKYDVKNIVFSDFYLRDSLGNTFNAISIEKTGDKIYVAEIMNFNNARGTVALVFKGGIDKNESGGNMDSFEGLFTPTGLVPVFLPAPKVVAIRNVEVIE